jgi:hypothetical protein
LPELLITFAAGVVLAAAWAEPDVYVAGFEEKTNGKIACYWKNGVKTVLPGGSTGGKTYAYAYRVAFGGAE